jgi:transcriptional regulator with GAF, ATPase, and Fis domain
MNEIQGRVQQERPMRASVETRASNGPDIISQQAKIVKDLALALLDEVRTLGDANSSDEGDTIDFYEEVRHFEIELIRRALRKTHGHQMRAARLLNMKVTTLNSMIKRYSIHPQAQLYNYPAVDANLSGLRRRA